MVRFYQKYTKREKKTDYFLKFHYGYHDILNNQDGELSFMTLEVLSIELEKKGKKIKIHELSPINLKAINPIDYLSLWPSYSFKASYTDEDYLNLAGGLGAASYFIGRNRSLYFLPLGLKVTQKDKGVRYFPELGFIDYNNFLRYQIILNYFNKAYLYKIEVSKSFINRDFEVRLIVEGSSKGDFSGGPKIYYHF